MDKHHQLEKYDIFVYRSPDSKQTYTLRRYHVSKTITCNCKGFQFNKRCKHVDHYIEYLRKVSPFLFR